MTAPTRQEIIDAHEALQNRIARRPLMDREEVLSIVHDRHERPERLRICVTRAWVAWT